MDFLSDEKHYWLDPGQEIMFDGYGASNYGQTHTMEISHYAIYDRAAKKHFPIDQARIKKFASQLPKAIDIFFEQKTKWFKV